MLDFNDFFYFVQVVDRGGAGLLLLFAGCALPGSATAKPFSRNQGRVEM
jgi:hypothetical protein